MRVSIVNPLNAITIRIDSYMDDNVIERINDAAWLRVDLHASRLVGLVLSDGHGYSVRRMEDLRAYDFSYRDGEISEPSEA